MVTRRVRYRAIKIKKYKEANKIDKTLVVRFNYDDEKIDDYDVISYITDVLEDNKHPCIEFRLD